MPSVVIKYSLSFHQSCSILLWIIKLLHFLTNLTEIIFMRYLRA